MRLYVADASPFARKCRIVARECGVALEEVKVDPMADDPGLIAASPIAQIPALALDDGGWLIDSPLICAWLDAHAGQPKLMPPPGDPAHWRVRRTETVADAGMEVAVKIVVERRRADGERSQRWIDRWRAGLARALAVADAEARPGAALDLGQIALGCVGGYLDFRYPDVDWRRAHPRLAALCAELEQRDSFRQTRPA